MQSLKPTLYMEGQAFYPDTLGVGISRHSGNVPLVRGLRVKPPTAKSFSLHK